MNMNVSACVQNVRVSVKQSRNSGMDGLCLGLISQVRRREETCQRWEKPLLIRNNTEFLKHTETATGFPQITPVTALLHTQLPSFGEAEARQV